MKKRLMSLLLSVAMIVSMAVVPTAAADTVTVSVDTVSGFPGDTVTVGVNVSNLTENDYVGAFQVEIPYDANSLEVVMQPSGRTQVAALPNTELWSGGTLRSNVKDGVISFGGMNADGWVGSGTVCTIQFKIKDDIAVDSVALPVTVKSFTLLGATAAEDQKLSVADGTLAAVNGAVNVTKPVTVSLGFANQESVTSANVEAFFYANVDGVVIEKTGVLYGASQDAIATEAPASEDYENCYMVTGAAESTIWFKAYAVANGVTYYSDAQSITLLPPVPTSIGVYYESEIEVTGETQEIPFTVDTVDDQFGGVIADAVVTWAVSEAQGVSIDAATGVLSVDKTAQSGTVIVTAACGDAVQELEIEITRPAPVLTTITASGAESIDVPTAAVGAATVALSATGVDQFDVEVPVEVTWSVSEAAGVSVEGNVLTVTNKAQAGTVTVTATAGSITDSFELTINKAAPVVSSISFESDAATLSIPVGDEANSKTFAVTGVDQFGDEIAVEATFALNGDDFVSATADGTVSVKKGATADKQYTLTATAGDATASMVVTVVSIEMTWPTVTVDEKATYGDTWADIITLSGGSAALDGVNVPGKFSVVDGTPNAGEQTYTIQFVSDDGAYNVTTTGTAAIAKKAVTATWEGFKGLTYGDAVNVTATAAVELTVSDNTNANAGTYTAKAAIAGEAAANYELTNAEQEYTVAPAEATITVPVQTIRAGKNGEQLAAQIGAIQAEGVNGEKVDGVLTVDGDITGYAAGKTASVKVIFTTENANYVSPISGTVEVTFTEGDPQEIEAKDLTATYGDDCMSVEAAIVKGGNGTITYASKNEKVAVVNEEGKVFFEGAGTAVITITAAADGDWAETTIERTVTVAPRPVTIEGLFAGDKAYDGKTDASFYPDFGAVNGTVGVDDVKINAKKAEAHFASANAGENITVTFSGFTLTGADADNYVLSAQPADVTANITKATPDVKVSKLSQTRNKVKDLVVTLSPASDDAQILVEYQLPAAEGETEGQWTTDVALVQAKGNYPVRVTVSGSANLEDVVYEATLKVRVPEPKPEPEPEPEPEVPEIVFTDVNENDWFYDYVIAAAEQGLFAGDETGAFNPNAEMNRAMIVTVLAAIEFEGEGAPKAECDFTDLTADWYKNAVAWAAASGITSGVTETEFAPTKAVTREQVAVFLYAYAKSKGVDVSSGEDTNILSYNDAFEISEWAIPAMQWACAEGLISGTPEGDLMPAGTATRAQVAVILTNFVELLK